MFQELLFDAMPDALIVVDQDNRIVRANAQAKRLFGYAEVQLAGQPIATLLPGDLRHRRHARGNDISEPNLRATDTGHELLGRKRDGSQFPLEIAISALATPEGQLYLASIRDVSQTQRARQARVRARYDAVMAQIGQMALSESSLDKAIQRALEPMAAALGVQATAVAFKHPQLPQMQVHTAFGIAPEKITGLAWSLVPHHLLRPSAPIVDTPTIEGFQSIAVVPLLDMNGPMGALLALSREQRSFDHDAIHFLQSIANRLAAVVQRTRIEEQLSHSQRLEAIGQLTGGVAHDFNNLLTVISGNLQILEDELTDLPAAREMIGSALRAVDRGAELTHKLLAFARRQRLSPQANDPRRLLGDLGIMLRRTLGDTINLEIEYAHDIGQIFADPGQLESALVNLVLNARDAMPRGGDLRIAVSRQCVLEADASAQLQAGDYMVFEVRDTGLGMAPDVLARVFEPFFTTKESGKGSGLGLSITYGFLKQSGGHLSVDSQLGYGTCVKLYLPTTETVAPGGRESSLPANVRGNETVLVVEDEGAVRDIAIAFLHSYGYTVVFATDAEMALTELANNDNIALVFSDVVLGPGMNGVELAEQIRRARPGLPILLTSGDELVASQNSHLDQAQIQLLPKPYHRRELGVSVRRLLDQHRLAGDAPNQ